MAVATFEQDQIESQWEKAEELFADGKRADAAVILTKISRSDVEQDNVEAMRAKEQAIYRLGEVLVMEKNATALMDLLRDVRPFFNCLPKAKTAKMVRKLFDNIFASGASLEAQHAVCDEMIGWAREERRTFLRHRLQHRLAEVLFAENDTQAALQAINNLLREVRRLDDRALLVDIHLLESRVYYSIRNISKSRAALVAARTNANSIYCPPLSQAEIDMQSGVLHAEEHDAKTAYSYLYEAFEGFHQLGDRARQARKALHYMILAKIATNNPDELATMFSSKSVLEYTGSDIDALKQIAESYKQRDTHQFNAVLQDPVNAEFHKDEITRRQLEEMYDSLVERHLLKAIEPYSRVQLTYLAELLRLTTSVVESRVSQMILDKKLSGIVDQQQNCLIIYDEEQRRTKPTEETFSMLEGQEDPDAKTTLHDDAQAAVEQYDRLVTALFDKISGKFDALVEENLKKRQGKKPAAKGKAGGEKGATDDSNKKGADSSKDKDEAGKGNSNKKDTDGKK